MRRPYLALAGAVASLPIALIPAVSAAAAPGDKPQVLSSWTQTSASSYNSWAAARQNQSAWTSYGFDWSTDYCTSSPDNPFGFPFQNACARHDFGYRNYKAAGAFSANKDRLDSAFYEDLKRVCTTYSGATRTACNSTAWTYYQAVRVLGMPPADRGAGKGLPEGQLARA
ncbi:phospholipase [Streptomyces sp. NPDC052701]|uniref:phospholipase n=1 Tax=Streptomyces sp. NPDC052701 TaxID=3155533 RepID=UPI003422E15A